MTEPVGKDEACLGLNHWLNVQIGENYTGDFGQKGKTYWFLLLKELGYRYRLSYSAAGRRYELDCGTARQSFLRLFSGVERKRHQHLWAYQNYYDCRAIELFWGLTVVMALEEQTALLLVLGHLVNKRDEVKRVP